MRCIALRHVHFEDAGILARTLHKHHFEIEYWECGRCSYDRTAWLAADLVLVLGGPIGVNEVAGYPFIRDELNLVEARLEQDLPMVGVCLGAQYMAHVLGANVYAGPAKEIGWSPVRLTEAGRAGVLAPIEGLPVLHWHGETFDLPRGASLLASTDLTPHQAFQVGSKQLGLQFHIECDPACIEAWLVGHCCELGHAGIDPALLREQTAAVCAAARSCVSAGGEVLERFLAQCGLVQK